MRLKPRSPPGGSLQYDIKLLLLMMSENSSKMKTQTAPPVDVSQRPYKMAASVSRTIQCDVIMLSQRVLGKIKINEGYDSSADAQGEELKI